MSSFTQQSSSKRARRSDQKSGSQNNFHHRLKCDSCNKSILSDHVQNNPCNHNICMMCVIKKNMMRGGSSNQSACCCCQVESCKQYLTSCQYFRAGSPGEVITNERGDDHNNITMPLFDDLGTDVLANIFGCLAPVDIMRARLNKKMRDAAKKTMVPLANFCIDSVDKYNAMAAMTTALPNLQQITIRDLDYGHKYIDGEDPDGEIVAFTADWATLDIDIISRFSNLRILEIEGAPLIGRYSALFNFPLLQKLILWNCYNLKWDLDMLEGLPSLKVLDCYNNPHLTGNLSSLRVLKDTLEKVKIWHCDHVEGNFMDLADFPHLKVLDCYNNAHMTGNLSSLRLLKDTLEKVKIGHSDHVEGNFMDLADFPHLKELDLRGTNVRGDIRDIREHDFLALKSLSLPESVIGGMGYEFQRISDAPDIISTIYSFKKQRPTLLKGWYGRLSEASPEWYYAENDEGCNTAPLYIVFVQAGSRLGYRWETEHKVPIACEVNWLDPEPGRESSEYDSYIEELEEIERQVDIYNGFHQPPTEEEHDRLWAESEDGE